MYQITKERRNEREGMLNCRIEGSNLNVGLWEQTAVQTVRSRTDASSTSVRVLRDLGGPFWGQEEPRATVSCFFFFLVTSLSVCICTQVCVVHPQGSFKVFRNYQPFSAFSFKLRVY